MHFFKGFSGTNVFGVALFILMGSIQGVSAQQLQDLEVNLIENPLNTIPVFIDHPEEAAIIVTSSLTNLRFNSNVEIVADKSDPAAGEYRIIIPPFRQTISVQANGFKQARFTVSVTEPRQVLFYTIEPATQEKELIPTFFSISPAQALDAMVFIDGQVVDVNRAVNLSQGQHVLRIEREGFRTINEVITVSENQPIRNYEMIPIQPQVVTITSAPTDARLEINNTDRGNTDYQGFLFPGEYLVRISKSGYKSVQQMINIIEDTPNSFDFILEEFGGVLDLNISPSDAEVFINRESVSLIDGETRVAPGTYTLEITADGFKPYSEIFTVQEDTLISRSIRLEQIVGSLQFSVQPISALVQLFDSDGNLFQEWRGARYFTSLPIGNYRIEVLEDDFRAYSRNLVIRENETASIDAQLIPIPRPEILEVEENPKDYEPPPQENRSRSQPSREREPFFGHRSFNGIYIHFNNFEANAVSFDSNVDESSGFGIGFFKYSGLVTTSFDFVYNTYSLTSESGSNLPDEIVSYNLSTSFVPTLPIGPVMLGFGAGLDFTQYEESSTDSFYYTYDAFYAFQVTIKPKSWNLGFMIDNRTSWDIGLARDYNAWTQLKYSIVIGF